MGDNLAQLMFEAHEAERVVRGDFNTDSTRESRYGRPRRWTELPIAEQDCWEAAARVARRTVADNVLAFMRRHFDDAPRDQDVDITVENFCKRWGR